MAATGTDVLSGNSNYYLELHTSVQSQSTSGNYSIVYYRIRVYKTAGSGYYAGTGAGNSVYVDTSVAAKDTDTGFSYDFRNGSNTGYLTFKTGTFRVNHNAAGAGSYFVTAGIHLYNLGDGVVNTGTINLPPLAKVPPAPTPAGIDTITSSSVRYKFTSNGDGGADITYWSVGYGTHATSPQNYKSGSSSPITIGGLNPATTYNFWVRGVNAVGAGPFSSKTSATTLAVTPPAPTAIGVDEITQTSLRYRFSGNGDGGSPITEWQIGYGTDPNTPSTFVTSTGTTTLINLQPGTTYYIWSRGKNAIGYGAWSAKTTTRTIAGARIRVSGVWKEAVPYVKHAGVWKLAKPYVRSGGIWKPTD